MFTKNFKQLTKKDSGHLQKENNKHNDGK